MFDASCKLFMSGAHRFGVVLSGPKVAIFGGGICETHPYPDTPTGHLAASIHFRSLNLGRLLAIADETMKQKGIAHE
jgi:hypothetical protein